MKFTFVLLSLAAGQQIGRQKANVNLPMTTEVCTSSGCIPQQNAVTLDANWRWLHKEGGYQNCYTGNAWDPTYCPNAQTCTQNCAVDGVPQGDWVNTYGITARSGKDLTLKFVTKGQYASNVGSRSYLLDSSGSKYEMFKLKNREFTFDVDVSKLPCGLNGALYFVEMDEDGGSSKYPGNKAGAVYGTGYCDAQCPHDIKFIDGEANSEGWKPSSTDKNAGTGKYGSCCTEMDIWESNSVSTAYTPHTCSKAGQYRCQGVECGDNEAGQRFDGVCDKDGCDFNSWRMGDKTFFGAGRNYTIDTTQPFTVITQFLTSDGTDNGELSEIKRFYVQNGKVIKNSDASLNGKTYDSITDEFCADQKTTFGDNNTFASKGGLKSMGAALERGMVLVMSLWDDHAVNMLWLDSDYPTTEDPTKPGVSRGPCATSSGKPDDVESNSPDATVKYFNIKTGTIGSTFPSSPSPSPPSPTPPSPTPPSPTPSGCPGSSLSACIGLCPSSPSVAYQACVKECVARCT